MQNALRWRSLRLAAYLVAFGSSLQCGRSFWSEHPFGLQRRRSRAVSLDILCGLAQAGGAAFYALRLGVLFVGTLPGRAARCTVCT